MLATACTRYVVLLAKPSESHVRYRLLARSLAGALFHHQCTEWLCCVLSSVDVMITNSNAVYSRFSQMRSTTVRRARHQYTASILSGICVRKWPKIVYLIVLCVENSIDFVQYVSCSSELSVKFVAGNFPSAVALGIQRHGAPFFFLLCLCVFLWLASSNVFQYQSARDRENFTLVCARV